MNLNKSILLAPNGFKECADSVTIAGILNKEFQVRGYKSNAYPVSDGGDGFLNVVKYYISSDSLFTEVSSLINERKINVEFAYSHETNTVYVESADILGLKLVPPSERHPLNFSSKGIGELLLNLKVLQESGNLKITKVVIGVGGTAVMDTGLGALHTLGLTSIDFYGKKFQPLPGILYKIADFEWNNPELPFNIECILDVNVPLTGDKGGIRIFGPQKGADKAEIRVAEMGIEKFCKLLKRKQLLDSSEDLPGAGGGIAAGLKIFLKAGIKYASEFILSDLGIENRIKENNVILTGEGTFDFQSGMGKGAGIILNEAIKLDKQVFLICGRFEGGISVKNLHIIELKKFFSSEEESIRKITEGLALAVEEIVGILKS